MASFAKIDTITNPDSTVSLHNGYPRRPGRIVEILASPCDGSLVKVGSGEYTFESVTAVQVTTTTYQRITGSLMSYVPPIGVTSVQYSFHFNTYWVADHAINDYKFFIKDAEVTYARHNRSIRYNEDRATFDWTIQIGGAANPANGQLSSWTGPHELYMMVRHYGASNYNNIHGTTYWDGAGGNQLGIPILTITAFA